MSHRGRAVRSISRGDRESIDGESSVQYRGRRANASIEGNGDRESINGELSDIRGSGQRRPSPTTVAGRQRCVLKICYLFKKNVRVNKEQK